MDTPQQAAPFSVVRRQFLESTVRFEKSAAVLSYPGEQLVERLDLLGFEPKAVLDLGCRNGYMFPMLAKRFPDARLVGADPAPMTQQSQAMQWMKWLQFKRQSGYQSCACDPHQLPFDDECFDLVVSNLFLPWCHLQEQVFAEVLRVLAPGGAFFYTSAGPDTLKEYRAAWDSIDSHVHVFGLVDMHDLGDTMVRVGFKAPVLDRDNVIVDYPDIAALQVELQNLGAANMAIGRRSGLMSSQLRQSLSRAAGDNDRFPVTLELVHGHAWKAEQSAVAGNAPGEFTVSIDSLKGSRRQKD